MSELFDFIKELICPDEDQVDVILDKICSTLHIKADNLEQLDKKLYVYCRSKNYLKKGSDVYTAKVPTRFGILKITEHRNYVELTYKNKKYSRQLESSYTFTLNDKVITRNTLSPELEEILRFFEDYVVATGGSQDNPHMDHLYIKAVHPIFPKDDIKEALRVVKNVSREKGISVADICERWVSYLTNMQDEERRYVASLSSFAKSSRVYQPDGDYPPIDLAKITEGELNGLLGSSELNIKFLQ